MPRKPIEPKKGDKSYIRRGAKGKFTSAQVSKSRLSADQRSKAKTQIKKGERDPGDQPKAKYLPTSPARSPFKLAASLRGMRILDLIQWANEREGSCA
jgi:hypothetical protein